MSAESTKTIVPHGTPVSIDATGIVIIREPFPVAVTLGKDGYFLCTGPWTFMADAKGRTEQEAMANYLELAAMHLADANAAVQSRKTVERSIVNLRAALRIHFAHFTLDKVKFFVREKAEEKP